jgi:branched-subunit amino acid aminotransferase/4-amino-4-deoxychorismate lyase
MKKFCYINGKIIPSDKASLPVADMAIMRGYAAFDFFRTYNGRIFRFNDYYNRFAASAKSLGLKLPISKMAIEEAIYSLLKKNKCDDVCIRLILTGGVSSNGTDTGKSNFIIMLEDMHALPKDAVKKGVKLITRSYERVFPEAKTTNYLYAIRSMQDAKKEKALEIVYVVNGYVYECLFSNIFLIKGNKLITPADSILKGITRKVVMELAEDEFKIEERDVTIEELLKADEVFMTGSNKRVLPVRQINDKLIAKGMVGEKTKRIVQLFDDYAFGRSEKSGKSGKK